MNVDLLQDAPSIDDDGAKNSIEFVITKNPGHVVPYGRANEGCGIGQIKLKDHRSSNGGESVSIIEAERGELMTTL